MSPTTLLSMLVAMLNSCCVAGQEISVKKCSSCTMAACLLKFNKQVFVEIGFDLRRIRDAVYFGAVAGREDKHSDNVSRSVSVRRGISSSLIYSFSRTSTGADL